MTYRTACCSPTRRRRTAPTVFGEEWKRYELGLAIVESKRWVLSLDGRADLQAKTAPSTQMLRYLRRVDDLTTGRHRAPLVRMPFRRDAFLPTAADRRTFHRRALEEGRYYEQRVATDLSNLVFDHVFPELARAIAEAAPDAPLPDVRDATLTLLYRLLFILYAEDRELLPVRDERYDDYGLRMRVRDDVRTRKDRNDVFSATATRYWTAIDDLAAAIDRGDASIGLPPYNGGLFNRERTPLLANVRLGDEVLADVIDTMSFERAAGGRRYINYRDLSVQQLGSIYERLLERELVRDGETVVVRPNVFARKGSGSYFTPHELVNLILEETVGPLVLARLDDFARASEDLTTRRLTREDRIFRSRRDASLTTAIYGRLPVLVDRSSNPETKAWPVRYERMFDMTNDSGLFRTRAELEDQEGAWPSGGNRFDSPTGEWLPLYEGKMVQAFDHRAARIVVSPANLHRPAQPEPATEEQHRDANWLPEPQYWVNEREIEQNVGQWWLGWKDVTAPTNARTIIAAFIPRSGVGNTLPVLLPKMPAMEASEDRTDHRFADIAPLMLANLNAIVLDYIARQKVQGQRLNLYIVEQLPVVPLDVYNGTRFGTKTAAEIVREAVLELT